MTSKYVKGHNLRAFIDGAGVGHAESCSFSLDVDTEEVSDKDVDPGATAPSAVALIAGKKRVTISSTGFVVESKDGTTASTGGYRTLLEKVNAGVPVAFKWTTDEVGDTVVSCDILLSKFTATGDDASKAKYSIEGKSTGSITIASVTV